MCNVSQFACFAFGKFRPCFLDQLIKLACLNIAGYLLIPALVFKLVKPLTKGGKILWWQITDAGFDSFNFAHSGFS